MVSTHFLNRTQEEIWFSEKPVLFFLFYSFFSFPFYLQIYWFVYEFILLIIYNFKFFHTNSKIGLAVGDIESIQKDAKLKREAMQVNKSFKITNILAVVS